MAKIGITGHRRLSDIDLAVLQVDHVLAKIRNCFDGPYTLYSSLAEGADQLVTRRALDLLNAKLIVPLPMKNEDFLKGFFEESKLSFLELLAVADQVIEMPSGLTHGEGYESAGLYVLDHIDVLITLWDGKPAKGRGGTGQIVAEARTRDLPIAWIHTREHIPGMGDIIFLGPMQENISFENFPEPHRKMV